MRLVRHRSRDTTHPDEAECLARHLRAHHVGGAPTRPGAVANVSLAFTCSSRNGQQQGHSQVRGAVGQDLRRVGHDDAGIPGGSHIDVVEPDPKVAEDPTL